jgi:hypothetical protein
VTWLSGTTSAFYREDQTRNKNIKIHTMQMDDEVFWVGKYVEELYTFCQ